MFTKLGYFCLEKKNLTLVFSIFFIPTLILSFYGMAKLIHYKQLEAKIASFELIVANTANQRKLRRDFLMDHFDADPNYLENFSLTAQFLTKEREDLNILSRYKIFKEDEKIQKRKTFLSSENELKFQKDQTKQKSQVKETRYFLTKPVEVDIDDVQNILLNLERKKKIPQCILYDFRLDASENNTYLLNLFILQREFSRKL